MKFTINAYRHFYFECQNFQEIWKSLSLKIVTLIKEKCHYFCTGVYLWRLGHTIVKYEWTNSVYLDFAIHLFNYHKSCSFQHWNDCNRHNIVFVYKGQTPWDSVLYLTIIRGRRMRLLLWYGLSPLQCRSFQWSGQFVAPLLKQLSLLLYIWFWILSQILCGELVSNPLFFICLLLWGTPPLGNSWWYNSDYLWLFCFLYKSYKSVHI